jgi:16S rRNA processing protein RimM
VQPEGNIREKNLFPIGRVVKPHGVKGRVKVEYFGEDLRRLSLYREVFIEDEKGKPESYEVLEAIPQPPRLILRLRGIEKIEETEHLIGKEILIEKEALPKLGEGEYYWVDVLEMKVETEEGKRIGKVREILPTGANDVYVIEGKRGEILLPATKEVIQSIDLKRGVMKVVRMEGLWEDEDEV